MFTMIIADDEDIVREGVKNIVNWKEIGFDIIGEAKDGKSTYDLIIKQRPDMVVLDIRMPKMHGLEIVKATRKEGYKGRFIILSGYSEFKYAQEAITYGVDFYLTKPIDEDELSEAAAKIYSLIHKEVLHDTHLHYYQEQAKFKILHDMIELPGEIKGKSLATYEITKDELDLKADIYQVLILDHEYETKDRDLTEEVQKSQPFIEVCQLLHIPEESKSIEHLVLHQMEVVVLKGKRLIERFREVDTYGETWHFIAAGRRVSDMNDIYFSYHDALAIKERRFFYPKNMRIVRHDQLPRKKDLGVELTAELSKDEARRCYEAIHSYNKQAIKEQLKHMEKLASEASNSVSGIKSFLSGTVLMVKHELENHYTREDLKLPQDATIIQWIQQQEFLTEVIDYIETLFQKVLVYISVQGSENVIDEIVAYIDHHYMDSIRLKDIAPKFGYNSSYLGKLLVTHMGTNFNDYLHQVRIDKAKELLTNQDLKVYEIAKRIGYKNVDYFHMKFKQYAHMTPNEYKTRMKKD